MTQLALIDAYQAFMVTAQRFVSITTEQDYRAALAALEDVLASASDTAADPLNPLIDMLSHAIERYESRDKALMEFVAEAEEMPVDIALVRSLMTHHNLTGSDLPEIGDTTMVSKVLKGQRNLTRGAIEKLSSRFSLRPSMVFGECT